MSILRNGRVAVSNVWVKGHKEPQKGLSPIPKGTVTTDSGGEYIVTEIISRVFLHFLFHHQTST